MDLPTTLPDAGEFAGEAFAIASLADEIRVDHLTEKLLRIYCRWLSETAGKTPEAAGAMARGADYFLRDFIIAECRENLFEPLPERIRQFGGHWYIVRNLEPNLAELQQILAGVKGFYRFLLEAGRIDETLLAGLERECDALEDYRERIETFWEISGDGYRVWQDACPLPRRPVNR